MIQFNDFTDESDEKDCHVFKVTELFDGRTKSKIHGLEFVYKTVLSECSPQE